MASSRCYEQTARAYVELLTTANFHRYAPNASAAGARAAASAFGSLFTKISDMDRLVASAALADLVGAEASYRPEPGLPRLGDMAGPVSVWAAERLGPDSDHVTSTLRAWRASVEALDLNAHVGQTSYADPASKPRARL